MSYEYWQKQDYNKPLFNDLIWSKPEQKAMAGKLLIIGGNLHAVSAPAESFNIVTGQGVGECKVILPSSTKKFFGSKPPTDIIFTSSTLSGSFGSSAFDELKSYLEWSDATMLAGDFGHNSETTLLLEKISNFIGIQLYTGDSIDNLSGSSQSLLRRPSTCLVVSLAQLQKIVANIHFNQPLMSTMSLIQIVEFLHDFSSNFPSHLILKFQDYLIVANSSQIISTQISNWPNNWGIKHASAAIVWWLQNPSKPMQAIATSFTQV